jgi:hypothetical protein|eukprot:COSAG01_NODE_7117_length_3343_cov_1.624538_1_plen_351_part_00
MTTAHHGRHEDDEWGSVTAALARTVLIRKLFVLPKLKAAAWFQPEDHVSASQVRATRRLRGKSWGVRVLGTAGMKAVHYGGIFGGGTLLFVGHDVVLSRLTDLRMDHLEEAPPLQSAVAGAAGGALYSLVATPIANFLRNDAASGRKATVSVLTRGLHLTLARDMGGFFLYFGAYTMARGALAPLLEGGATAHAISEGHQLSVGDVCGRATAASLAGGLGAACAYQFRSPLDTLYKVHIGVRPSCTPLLSWERFLASPRGLKHIALGAATWGCYEVVMLGVARLHYVGQQMERLDEAAFVTWSGRIAYEKEEFGTHGRLHRHECDPDEHSRSHVSVSNQDSDGENIYNEK